MIESFEKLRAYCEAEHYKGWDPYDGLNSRVFQALPLLKRSALCRLVMIQGFKRCPVNLRRLALVPKEHNAKGIGLFLQGYCNLYRAVWADESLAPVLGGREELMRKVNEIAGMLLEMRSILPVIGGNGHHALHRCHRRHALQKTVSRLLVEIIVALFVIFGTRLYVSDFQGLWGIGRISPYFGIPLSVLTFIGLVNAINMIDGIDGLCTGFSIMILGFFGAVCFLGHGYAISVLAVLMIGALIPFFIHNVIGYTTKMFIGDSGTMMVGTAVSVMVFYILRLITRCAQSSCIERKGFWRAIQRIVDGK